MNLIFVPLPERTLPAWTVRVTPISRNESYVCALRVQQLWASICNLECEKVLEQRICSKLKKWEASIATHFCNQHITREIEKVLGETYL